jgi:hypothetical protein
VRDRVEQLARERLDVDRTAARLGERAAGDVLHDEELAASPGIEIEDRSDARVREPREHERLSPEPLTTRRVTQGSVQEHLDGNIPVEVVVVCFPHLAHTAFANAFEESIPAENGTGPD